MTLGCSKGNAPSAAEKSSMLLTQSEASATVFLTPDQHATLCAALERIIPSDDGFPGAREAGVDGYFLRQFERDLASALPMYQDCLDALQAEAHAAHDDAPFATLPADDQDTLLARIEEGETNAPYAWHFDPALFFKRLIEHAHEGFYGDPGNGGNKNGVAWQMIGFEVTK